MRRDCPEMRRTNCCACELVQVCALYSRLGEGEFKEERAVFEIPLRSKQRGYSLNAPLHHWMIRSGSHHYALSNSTDCAHCAKQVRATGDEGLRTALSGRTEKNGTIRYRHRSGLRCGCSNRTVTTTIIEDDIGRLLNLIPVSKDVMPHLVALAEQHTETVRPHRL